MSENVVFEGIDDYHGHLMFHCPCGATIQKDLHIFGTTCEHRDLYFDEGDFLDAINAAVRKQKDLRAWAVAWADYHGKEAQLDAQEYGEESSFYLDHYVRHMAFYRFVQVLNGCELEWPPEE